MISLSTARRIAVSAERVWAMISTSEIRDFVTGTYIQGVSVEGDGPGAILTITMNSGVVLKERIDGLDPVEREYSYSVVDSGPLDYAYCTGTMRVQPCGPNESILSARSSFIVVDGAEDRARDAWYTNNRTKLKMIADYLEAK